MELFRPDNPISNAKEDRFQRYTFAKRIADIVSNGNYPKSIVVGVYGKWGEGKTSILNFVQNEISDDTIIINFNPWLFQEQKQLLKSFFESIAIALGKKLKTRKEQIADIFSDYADSLGTFANAFLPYSIGSIFGIGKKVTERLKKDSVEDLKKKVDDLIIEAQCRIVIFIDDIDRLDIEEVQAIFKLVKLAGDFPRTSYILSFDDDKVASAIGPQYGNGNKASGYEFLEKIIQIPLQIPKASKQVLRTYTLELLDNVFNSLKIPISKSETSNFIGMFDEAFLPVIDNPRLGIRFANTLRFSLPLLYREVDLGDLMAIEGLKIFFPELYHFISKNESYFLRTYSDIYGRYSSNTSEDVKTKVKKAIDQQLSIYGNDNAKRILEMLTDLFPQLKTLYQNYAYPNEYSQKWYREKKICSSYYFQRYFSYVVQEGDISDVIFEELFTDVDTITVSELKDKLQIEIPKLNEKTFVFKFYQHVSTFNETGAATVAKALVQFGKNFSTTKEFLGFSSIEQAGTCISILMERMNTKNRLQVCLDVLQLSTPFSFTMEIHYNFKIKNKPNAEKHFLTDTEFNEISKYLTDRFQEEIEIIDMFTLLSDMEIWRLLYLFREINRTDKARNTLMKQLEKESIQSLNIIKIFTSTVQSSSKPLPYKSNFTDTSFNDLLTFTNAEILYQKTIEAFGKIEFKPIEDLSRDEITDENLIALFQLRYEEYKQKQKDNKCI